MRSERRAENVEDKIKENFYYVKFLIICLLIILISSHLSRLTSHSYAIILTMKKIFLIVVLLLSCAKVFAADYYLVGVDAFKKGVYDKAASNLEHALRINSKNVNARYYLAQTYLMQNRVFDAKTQYSRIILLAPDSDAALLSEKGLSLIRQAQMGKVASAAASGDVLAMYRDNYLDYVLTDGGKIIKWASFPLTVYIEPKSQKVAAQRAFEQWQEKTDKLVLFSFVNSPANAQIVVDFKDKLESSSGKESYIAGYSSLIIKIKDSKV